MKKLMKNTKNSFNTVNALKNLAGCLCKSCSCTCGSSALKIGNFNKVKQEPTYYTTGQL